MVENLLADVGDTEHFVREGEFRDCYHVREVHVWGCLHAQAQVYGVDAEGSDQQDFLLA